MSIDIMRLVFEKSKTRGEGRLILLALADNASDEGYCWPAHKTIARKARASLPTVKAYLKVFERMGLLTVQSRFGENGMQSSNGYLINRDVIGADEVSKELLQAAKPPSKLKAWAATPPGNAVTPPPLTRLPAPPTNAVSGPPTNTVTYESSLNPKINQQGSAARGVRFTQSGHLKRESTAPKAWWEREPARTVKGLTGRQVPESRREKIEAAWAACLARGENPAQTFAAYHAEFTRRGGDTGWWWVEEWLMQGWIPERGARRQAQPLAAPETFAAVVVR